MKKKKQVKNLQVSDSMKNIKKAKLERVYVGINLLLISSNLLVIFLTHSLRYAPGERKILTDNVFDSNEVIISYEEQQDIYRELEKELGIKISDDNINYLLLNAIRENPYLNKKEKEIFYKFIEYFNDNPYLNLEEVYENMLNVDSQFTLRKSLGAKESTLAVYLPRYYDIIYFELFPTDETRAHEGVHCVNGNIDLPRWFSEGMTQLITNEYFKEYPFSPTMPYQFEVALIKLLCEIIGTDRVLEAYTKNNVDLIYESLSSITGTKEDAQKMLDFFGETYNLNSDEPISKEELSKYLEQLLVYMSKEEILENSSAVHSYLMLSSVLVEDAADFVEGHIVCKAYLSSSLKEKGFANAILMTTEEYQGNPYKK